jgi:AcrR family transcriptional regulator
MVALNRNAHTRRTEGVRGGRSLELVDNILDVTLAELGRVGYAELRVDEIAVRCAVNKTTIYRRWPTKDDLVLAALMSFSTTVPVPDTGSVRSDVLGYVRGMIQLLATPKGHAMFRVVQAEKLRPEFEPVLRRLRAESWKARGAIFERGVARGELPKGCNARLLAEMCFCPIMIRFMHFAEAPDWDYIEQVLEVTLAGAHVTVAKPAKRARSRP